MEAQKTSGADHGEKKKNLTEAPFISAETAQCRVPFIQSPCPWDSLHPPWTEDEPPALQTEGWSFQAGRFSSSHSTRCLPPDGPQQNLHLFSLSWR